MTKEQMQKRAEELKQRRIAVANDPALAAQMEKRITAIIGDLNNLRDVLPSDGVATVLYSWFCGDVSDAAIAIGYNGSDGRFRAASAESSDVAARVQKRCDAGSRYLRALEVLCEGTDASKPLRVFHEKLEALVDDLGYETRTGGSK